MSQSSDRDKLINDEVAKRLNREKEARRLKDPSKQRGLPAPDDHYIDVSLNVEKQLSSDEIKAEALEKVLEQERTNQRAREMLPELQRKMEGRREPVEKETSRSERGVESGRDRLKSDERGSMRDKLRNNRNGRDGLER